MSERDPVDLELRGVVIQVPPDMPAYWAGALAKLNGGRLVWDHDQVVVVTGPRDLLTNADDLPRDFDDDGCTNPGGHEWAENDAGDAYCLYCNADGDA